MDLKHYKITCLNCKNSNIVAISPDGRGGFLINLDEDHRKNPEQIYIISGRYRPDLQFGWECICRNTSMVCRQEINDESDIKKIMPMGQKSEIKRLAKSLKTPDEKKFTMVEL